MTIRRLAADLGVTPMALYWHYKNKEQLIIGMADHLISPFAPKEADDRPWQEQLRDLTQGLVGTLRAYPCAKTVRRPRTQRHRGARGQALESRSWPSS
ncbi:TetR family transcriptional regulator [Nonomuraea sp. NPDC049421]|uniref:TetR/AcrR family transcriptional regulator n=1 Tax=Nonomuraea sp. NPDC049421 TaxID=3155275 RepID=UPI00343EE38C